MSNSDSTASEGFAVEQRNTCGCVAVGCLGAAAFAAVAAISFGFAGYWFVSGQVKQYTSEIPAKLPVVEYSDEQLSRLEQRIESFQSRAEEVASERQPVPPSVSETASEPPTELVLSADDINALIAEQPDLRGRLHITIADGKIQGDVSIPMDQIPGGRGRYLNASGIFEVALKDGELAVRMTSANVKGQPLPPQVMEPIRSRNFAREAMDDPETAEKLRRFESIRVEGDRLVVRLRDAESVSTSDETPDGSTSDQPVDAVR